MLPYETNIRIPLFIKGPGIKPGTSLTQPVMNIDIAPVRHTRDVPASDSRPHKRGVDETGLGRLGSVCAL